LALGVEEKATHGLNRPMMRGKCHEGSKNAKEMVRKCEK
jgi:hypothetical protein